MLRLQEEHMVSGGHVAPVITEETNRESQQTDENMVPRRGETMYERYLDAGLFGPVDELLTPPLSDSAPPSPASSLRSVGITARSPTSPRQPSPGPEIVPAVAPDVSTPSTDAFVRDAVMMPSLARVPLEAKTSYMRCSSPRPEVARPSLQRPTVASAKVSPATSRTSGPRFPFINKMLSTVYCGLTSTGAVLLSAHVGVAKAATLANFFSPVGLFFASACLAGLFFPDAVDCEPWVGPVFNKLKAQCARLEQASPRIYRAMQWLFGALGGAAAWSSRHPKMATFAAIVSAWAYLNPESLLTVLHFLLACLKLAAAKLTFVVSGKAMPQTEIPPPP